MNRRDLVKSLGASAFAASVFPVWARRGRGGTAAASPRPLGVNLAGVNYFSSELPFLNIVKQGGQASNSVSNGWITGIGGSTFETNEEAYLQLDSDYYVTSLTASPIPSGGQQFNQVTCFFVSALNTAPNASAPYFADTYRFEWQGKATLKFGGDVTALANASAGCTISGTQVTSTNTWGTTNSVTLQGSGAGGILTPTSAGISLVITAIPDSANYPKAFSCVQSTYTSLFDGGEIFHPTFIASVQNFKSLRFMDWLSEGSGNNPYPPLDFSGGTLSSGATTGTLTAAWAYPTQTRTVYFSNGDQRQTVLTLNSTTADWSAGGGALSSSVGTTVQGASVHTAYISWRDTWANRSLPSNAFWTVGKKGVPLEICVALCNKIGAAGWFNVPMTASSSFINSFIGCILNGTGMQSGFSALGSTLGLYLENSNELWNTASNSAYFYQLAVVFGSKQFGGSGPGYFEYNQCWNGYQAAQIANAAQTIAGASFSRVYPLVACQAATQSSSGVYSCTTPLWTSGQAVKIAPIKGVAIAPYFGNPYTTADMTTMMSVATPLDDFFACLTSQTGTTANGSKSYSASVPSGGWMTATQGWISSYQTYVTGLTGTMEPVSLVAYEGGQSFIPSTTVTGWQAMVESAERDTRMGSAYTTLLDYWATNVSALSANMFHVFDDCYQPSQYGAWGVLESILQPLSGSNTPTRYQAVQNYIAGH